MRDENEKILDGRSEEELEELAKEGRRIAYREWYEKNRERKLKQQRAYYAAKALRAREAQEVKA